MITHYYYIVPDLGRVTVVRNLVTEAPDRAGIIFCQTKKDVLALTKQLQSLTPLGSLHGNTSQLDRENTLEAWTKQQLELLIVTQAMGEGLGGEQVGYVIHYQLPPNPDAYRQARAELYADDGVVITLVSPDQEAFLKRLQEGLSVEILKHPDCEAEFTEADALEEMKRTGKKSALPGKNPSKNTVNTRHKPKGNQPFTPTRHI